VLGKSPARHILRHVILMLFVLMSVPLGCFCCWFAWQAWKVGRMDVVKTMAVLAICCFITALLAGGWALLVVEQ